MKCGRSRCGEECLAGELHNMQLTVHEYSAVASFIITISTTSYCLSEAEQ